MPYVRCAPEMRGASVLMLRRDVVEAAGSGRFRNYAVELVKKALNQSVTPAKAGAQRIENTGFRLSPE